MADSYSPASVSLGNLAEAAAAGVNLAIQDQSSEAIIGPTTGIYPTEPDWP
jgi:hypothetical protein